MQKLQHKIVVLALAICFAFICPVSCCKAEIPVVRETAEDITMDSTASPPDLDIEPINTEKVKKNVVPDTKSEIKKVIGLFLKAMAAMAFCAVLVCIISVFVSKYYRSAFTSQNADDEEYDNLELTTPEDKISALKSFLNRTKN